MLILGIIFFPFLFFIRHFIRLCIFVGFMKCFCLPKLPKKTHTKKIRLHCLNTHFPSLSQLICFYQCHDNILSNLNFQTHLRFSKPQVILRVPSLDWRCFPSRQRELKKGANVAFLTWLNFCKHIQSFYVECAIDRVCDVELRAIETSKN